MNNIVLRKYKVYRLRELVFMNILNPRYGQKLVVSSAVWPLFPVRNPERTRTTWIAELVWS